MAETIIGTEGDDLLTGTGGSDVLLGLAGDDVLRGWGGDDLLRGGPGDDTLIGGGGFDTADFRDRTNVRIDLSDPDEGGFGEALVVIDFDGGPNPPVVDRDRVQVAQADGVGVEAFLLTDGLDRFVGTDRDEVVQPLAGDDVLDGRGGTDTLRYEDTAIQLNPGDADLDLVVGFGDGSNFADFVIDFEAIVSDPGQGSIVGQFSEFSRFVRPLDLDLAAERATFGGGDSGLDDLTIRVVGFDDAIGSDGDDTILGDDGANTVFGTPGDDVLRGGPGSDVLTYARGLPDGAAVIFGIGGIVEILRPDGTVLGRDTVGAFDLAAGEIEVFETVVADPAQAARNTIAASDGFGGLRGAVSVRVDLEAGRIDASFEEALGGFEAGESFGFDLEGFGAAVGSGRSDVLLGDDGANVIRAGGGDDTVRGRGGDDRLGGGEGDDDLRGGSGDDRLDGRRGEDNLIGGAGDDRVFGQEGDDVLRGGAGADQLGGGDGADTFRWTSGDIAADAGVAVDIVDDLRAEDLLLLAGRELTAGETFELADEEAVRGGVSFALNVAGTQIVLRADGEDQNATIDADEVFARLRFDADEFPG